MSRQGQKEVERCKRIAASEDFGKPVAQGSLAAPSGYAAGIEYSKGYAEWMPNNCAVIERTADGVSVGPCTHYLENGTTCPRHGKVKPHNEQAQRRAPEAGVAGKETL